MKLAKILLVSIGVFSLIFSSAKICRAQGQDYSGNEDPNKKIIKQGLLGAGVGAISASASGGKAGQGALIGAGTNVIGGALLDTLTTPSQPQRTQYVQQAPVQYVQAAPQYTPQAQQSYPVQPASTYRQEPQPVYVQQAPAYYNPPPQEDPNKKILKQGLLGAGVGAISASASGGSAGKGALIGAGTNVIGGALLDTLMSPSQPQQPQPVYYQQASQPQYQYQQQSQPISTNQPHKKIIRKYDSDGNVVSEEEVWE
ncbi:MAG: hypothetical protein AUJ72_05565 [Candidatus Omnitrophica bacterium CG1_02_46_14]|nr:MAG: hypothetical protein AUJ72_05565 [Candidatus Omnitrophica bacterium CG1_02_46_14]